MSTTINKVKILKHANDTKGDNTYLICNFNGKFEEDLWHKDELCFVKDVSTSNVSIFRPMDGKLYNLNENSLKKFILIDVII